MSPEELMRLALNAAVRTDSGKIRPNPQVGAALLTRDGKVHSHAHQIFGGHHAERALILNCLEKKIDVEGATMAVTLEPCNHFGKTPPCADLLIEHKIKKVYIGALDPNPKSKGGILKLQNVGIECVTGLLQKECEDLNYEWLQAHRLEKAFLRVKIATSLDGAWGPEPHIKDKKITGLEARQSAMGLRARAQVLMTSGKTLRDDKPQLNVRDIEKNRVTGPHPDVWVLSSEGLEIEKFFSQKNEKSIPKSMAQESQIVLQNSRKLRFLRLNQNNFKDELLSLLRRAHQEDQIHSILLEAGPSLTQKIIEIGIFDELVIYMNAQFIGGAHAPRMNKVSAGGLNIDKRLVFSSIKHLSAEDIEMKLLSESGKK